MKPFILSLFVVFAGCTWVQTSTFDPIEYNGFVELMTIGEKVQQLCEAGSTEQLIEGGQKMESNAHHLHNYTFHRINNKSTYDIVTTLRETTAEFLDRYENGGASALYCIAKTDIIVQQSKMGADAVQQKVRR